MEMVFGYWQRPLTKLSFLCYGYSHTHSLRSVSMKHKIWKIGCIALILMVPAGNIFAQNAANTATLDVGPLLAGAGMGSLLNTAASSTDLSGFGFGIGAQYERELVSHFSVAGRFAFMNVEFAAGANTLGLSSFSFEAHGRFYPFAKGFFLDGMIGFATFAMDFKGSTNLNAIAYYFKPGLKVGWKIDFGRPGGFVFEPSFGWSFAFGTGNDDFTKISDEFGEGIEDAKDTLAEMIFVGGPRLSLNFGWAF
jgi:hypothetical protein